MSLAVEAPRATAEDALVLDDDRPARRRRSALLVGAVLVASSSVAVAAGLFVPGFAALGLGALLLLLPPTVQSERAHRSPLRVARKVVSVGAHRVVALARGGAHLGAGAFKAVKQFVANEGRDATVRTCRAASAVGSRGWSVAQLVASAVWRGLVTATRSFGREARATSVRAWDRSRPILRRAWVLCLAGSRRAAHELAVLQRAASERLSTLVDSSSDAGQLRSLPPRAPRPPTRGPAQPVRRAPARIRSGRSRRPPPSSR